MKNEATVHITGWLNDVKTFDWGSVAKVAVDVRKKNDNDQWETVDKTVYDCTIGEQLSLDNVRRVTVIGKIRGIKNFEKRDGSVGFTINVRAESIEQASDDKIGSRGTGALLTQYPGAKVVDEAPF